MSTQVEYLTNKASEPEIAEHLFRTDAYFVPPLSSRVEINGYAKRIVSKATRQEAWVSGTLVGLVAVYSDDLETYIGYITNVSVLKEWIGKGIATRLMKQCIEHTKTTEMRQISLEVASDNLPAISLYEKSGFVLDKGNGRNLIMNLHLKSGE